MSITLTRWMFVLSLAVGALGMSLALRPMDMLAQRPLTEDGYYGLSVSRNIAAGRGITIDGQQPTNGFQPLSVAVNVLAYGVTGGDRYQSLRIVLVLQALCHIAAGYVFALVLRDIVSEDNRMLVFASALLIYLASVFVFWQHFNGLETGMLLLCYLLVARCFQKADLGTKRGAILLGALLGVLVLARIDATFFVVACVLVIQLTGVTQQNFVGRIRTAIIVAAVSALVSSPWWLYNYFGFGSLMPSSGTAQQQWGLQFDRLWQGVYAVAVCASPVIYFAGGATLASFAAYVAMFLLQVGVFATWGRSILRRAGQSNEAIAVSRRHLYYFAVALLIACVGFFAWYVSTSWSTHFYRRYLAPLSLLSLFFAVIGFASVCNRFPRLGLPMAAALCAPIVLLIALLWQDKENNRSIFYDSQLRLVNEHVPSGARVGAYQSGTLGYFRDGVLNLDGKVNHEALRRQGDMDRYLQQKGVTWFCDWIDYAHRAFGNQPEKNGWVLVASRGDFYLFRFVGIQGSSSNTELNVRLAQSTQLSSGPSVCSTATGSVADR